MMTFKLLTLTTCLVSYYSVHAFAPRHHHLHRVAMPGRLTGRLDMDPDNNKVDVANIFNGFLSNISNFDLDGLTANTGQITENLLEGEFGTRGENYVAAQVFLVLCILFGGVPVVGDYFEVLMGPVLLLLGAAIILKSVTDMGGSLNIWPVPSTNNKLITDGAFGLVRHPIYTGLLCSMAGLSVVTDSASRLILTVVLFYALDIKSDFEEKSLEDKFGTEYSEYTAAVPGKFFPTTWTSQLPWMK